MKLPCVVVLCLVFTQTHSWCSDGYSIKCDNLADVKSYGNRDWVSLVIGDSTSNLVPNDTLQSQEFAKLPNLEDLAIIAAVNEVDSKAFDNLPNLLVLKLYKNSLRSLSDSIFVTIPQLSRLDLQNNNIEQLTTGAGSPVNSSNLITVNLSHNKLRKLFVNTFKVPGLKRLIITHNQLSELGPASIFSSDLNYLNLKHNSLYQIRESVFRGMANLEELVLSYNQFATFRDKYTLKDLEKFDLSHNRISAIGPGVFDGMPKLMELHLNHNLLTELPVDNFQANFKQLKIRYLNLHNNRFQSMQFLVKGIWPELVTLTIINNPWPCDCLNQFLTSTIAQSKVRLSYCEQSFFREGTFPVCVEVETKWDDGKCSRWAQNQPYDAYDRFFDSVDKFRCKVGSL